jgi:hypothetical protein
LAGGPPRFVRQFAWTKGRARSGATDLPLETQVEATARGHALAAAQRLLTEQTQIVSLCATPMAIAEIAARLHMHLGVARVIVTDLAKAGLVAVTLADVDDDGPDLVTLERLLDDLQAL